LNGFVLGAVRPALLPPASFSPSLFLQQDFAISIHSSDIKDINQPPRHIVPGEKSLSP
jgi:hypothetical protein